MIYITLLDQFHPGIYSGQVIDVIDYLNKKHDAKIRLVAFLSIRELLRSDAKKKIKALSKNAIVLPAFPGLKNFELTGLLLVLVCLFTGEREAICRNAFCAKMALRVKKIKLLKKVIFDSRSSLNAEISEYDVFPVDYLRKNISRIEKYVVNNSDFNMAVSSELVNYWVDHYGYQKGKEVVIPCTLDSKFYTKKEFTISNEAGVIKSELGILEDDIVLVYAGSTAPWQSFELLEKELSPLLTTHSNIKLMFLSRESEDNLRMQQKFPGRVFVKWVDQKDVLTYLSCCDYGILLREQSDTNKVASPVKFAEYLYAGLPVIISENLGDFSNYVKVNNCGAVLNEDNPDWSFLHKVKLEDKKRYFDLAMNNFKKEDFEDNYRMILQ